MSCSSDDDDNGDDVVSNGFELYLDNVKQGVSTSSNIEYNSSNVVGEPQLKAYIYGNDDAQFTSLAISFDNLKLSDIKVGDDLVSKNDVITYYMLICDKGIYTMGNGTSNIGQAIVKKFDSSSKKIDIEFKDVKVTNGKNDYISMKGRIDSTIK